MYSGLKFVENRHEVDERVSHDAHVRAYEANKMRVKVVLCDSKGVPFSESFAPLASYFPATSHNV